MIPFIGSTSPVVHSYAAAAVERILLVKDTGRWFVIAESLKSSLICMADATGRSTPRLAISSLDPHIKGILTACFKWLNSTSTKFRENDYLMKVN